MLLDAAVEKPLMLCEKVAMLNGPVPPLYH
jgi:hypothetical protein